MTSLEQQTGDFKLLTIVEGGCIGALTGGLAFAVAALGTIAIPGIGSAVAVAPLTVAIASASVGAAAGGVVGALLASAGDRQ